MDASGVLFAAGDLHNSLNGLRSVGAELGSAFDKLGIEQALQSGNPVAATLIVSMRLLKSVTEETTNAVANMQEAYDKALSIATNFYDKREKENKSGNASDRITDSGLDPKTEAAIKELGAVKMGMGQSGTWYRSAKNIGAGLSDFFSGDNTQEDMLREGKKAAADERQKDENNKKEQARRQFEKDAQAHNFQQEQEEYKKWAREQAEIDKREEIESKTGAARVAHEEVSSLDKFFKESAKREQMAERFKDQESMNALNAPRDNRTFQSKIEGLEATYNRIQTAASSEDPTEKTLAHQKELHVARTALMEKQHREALEKQDEAIAAAREAAGTG